jgi:hypothetical protein
MTRLKPEGRPAARSNLPPEAAKKLEDHIREKSRAAWDRVELGARGLTGVVTTDCVDAARLRRTFIFADETGELGRVDAVYGGPNLSLNALLCGVRDGPPEEKTHRERVMSEIYEIVKTAFEEVFDTD